MKKKNSERRERNQKLWGGRKGVKEEERRDGEIEERKQKHGENKKYRIKPTKDRKERNVMEWGGGGGGGGGGGSAISEKKGAK